MNLENVLNGISSFAIGCYNAIFTWTGGSVILTILMIAVIIAAIKTGLSVIANVARIISAITIIYHLLVYYNMF